VDLGGSRRGSWWILEDLEVDLGWWILVDLGGS
jgi:hypothetical protein